MTKSDETLGKVVGEYYLLQLMNPNHELLKYYTLQFPRGFWPNENPEIIIEFKRRFSNGIEKLLSDIAKSGVSLPKEEFNDMVSSLLLQNYYEALKREVSPPEMIN